MRDQRSVVLHLVGQGEAGFSKPDPDRPELVHTRAGLELPLDRVLFETVRQRRRAAVLMGEAGEGKSAFLDEVSRGLHLPDGLQPVRLTVPPGGDASALDAARSGSGSRRLFLVDSLDRVDPGSRRGLVAALVAAVEAAEGDVWLVASRFGSFEATSLGGRFAEFHLRPVSAGRGREPRARDGSPSGAGGVTFTRLEGGTFLMGSSDDEEGRWADEGPRHEVRVPPFELALTPVTNLQYERFLEERPAATVPAYWGDVRFNGDQQPVVGVWWEDARAFADWAGARLPSESEWEYACRGGVDGPRYGELDRIAWWIGNSGGVLHPVGTRAPNAFGLYDMIGNTWEYVEDDRHDSYAGAPTDGSPWVDEPRRGVRLLRGGSWADAARVVRSTTRLTHHPGPRVGNVGFRVARTVTSPA